MGDPQPAFFELVDSSLLQRPAATLGGRWDGYAEALAGGVALLAGALFVLLRSALGAGLSPPLRRVLLAAGVTVLMSLLIFAAAPGTGAPRTHTLWFGPFSTLRYVLPTLGAATIAVALASRAGRITRAASLVVLAAALVWNVIEDARLGQPYLPRAGVLLLGAAAGVLVLGAATAVWRALAPHAPRPRPLQGPVLVAVVAVVAGLALAPAADGYLERHGRVERSTALGRDVAAWLAARPALEDGDRRIGFATRAMTVTSPGTTSRTSSCCCRPERAAAGCAPRRRRGLVVVAPPSFLLRFVGVAPYRSWRCFSGRPIGYRRGQLRYISRPASLHVQGTSPSQRGLHAREHGGDGQEHGTRDQHRQALGAAHRCAASCRPPDRVIDVGMARQEADETVQPAEDHLPAAQVAHPLDPEPELPEALDERIRRMWTRWRGGSRASQRSPKTRA